MNNSLIKKHISTLTMLISPITALLLTTGSTSAIVNYHVDQLVGANHDDITVGAQADIWWANQFTTEVGGERITQIGLSFGNNLTVGGPISLLIYNDLNNDGSPADAVLLRKFDTTISESDGNYDEPTFFNIPTTTVSGSFFIGALLLDVPGNAGITFHNEPGESLGQSWIGAADPNTLNPSDLSTITTGPGTLDSFGVPGNWVLRAVGTPVPEPSTVALGFGGAALAAAFVSSRRRKKITLA